MKVCRTCKRIRQLTSFYKTTARNNDGHVNDCKQCYNAKTNAYKAANVAAVRRKRRHYDAHPTRVAARKAYAQTACGREASRRASRLYQRWKRLSERLHSTA